MMLSYNNQEKEEILKNKTINEKDIKVNNTQVQRTKRLLCTIIYQPRRNGYCPRIYNLPKMNYEEIGNLNRPITFQEI